MPIYEIRVTPHKVYDIWRVVASSKEQALELLEEGETSTCYVIDGDADRGPFLDELDVDDVHDVTKQVKAAAQYKKDQEKCYAREQPERLKKRFEE